MKQMDYSSLYATLHPILLCLHPIPLSSHKASSISGLIRRDQGRDGHAIGFRCWVSPARVYETEDATIAAAMENIRALAEAPPET